MRTLQLEELPALVGQEVAQSEWLVIDQDRINRFAEATDDHQWIHVDAVKAAAGPYKRTVAHGFLTLSLIPRLFHDAISIQSQLSINYGLNKVRFPHPVLVDSRIRGRFLLADVEPLPPLQGLQGYQISFNVTIECEGVDKPACVAEMVSRRYE
jgi:acyl dehydratase